MDVRTSQSGGPVAAVEVVAALGRVGTALADENRRRLLLALGEGPAFPSELADRLGMTRANVSNHLSCLRGCGLLRGVPAGRRVRYEFVDPNVAQALTDLAVLVSLIDPERDADRDCRPDEKKSVGSPPGDATTILAKEVRNG